MNKKTLRANQRGEERLASGSGTIGSQPVGPPPARAAVERLPAESSTASPQARDNERATSPCATSSEEGPSSDEEEAVSAKAQIKEKQKKKKQKGKARLKKAEQEQRERGKVKKKSKTEEAKTVKTEPKPKEKALSAASGSQGERRPDLDQAIEYTAHLSLIEKGGSSRLAVMARGPNRRKQQVSVDKAGGVMRAARIAAVLSAALHEDKTAAEIAVLRDQLCAQPPERPVINWTDASRPLMETLGETDLDGVVFVSEGSSAIAAEELADDEMMTDMNAQIKALSKMQLQTLEKASSANDPGLSEIKIGGKIFDRCAVETAIEEGRMCARQALK